MQKRMRHLLLSFLSAFTFHAGYMRSYSFMYPVAYHKESNCLYFIYQKTVDHLELWSCDHNRDNLNLVLTAPVVPACLAIIPDKNVLSIIDNDIIKIKEFKKRSAKVIDLNKPLYRFSQMHWINSFTFYMSAQLRDHFGIFEIDDYGNVRTLVHDDTSNYLSPQKIGEQIFYIEHDNHTFTIKCSLYNCMSDNVCIHKQNNPIFALIMVTNVKGFFVEYAFNVQNSEGSLVFHYYELKYTSDGWQKNFLFTFTLLSNFFLFDGDMRLYEGALRLLPQYSAQENVIYYVDTTENEDGSHLNIFAYDMENKKIVQQTYAQQKNEHCFAPLVIDDLKVLYFGGSLVQQKERQN